MVERKQNIEKAICQRRASRHIPLGTDERKLKELKKLQKRAPLVPEGIVKDTYRRIIEEIQQGDKSALWREKCDSAQNGTASATKISETEKINKIKRFPTKRISKWVVMSCADLHGVCVCV